MLAAGAWHSWTRLQAVDRIADAAGASADMFTALHNLRLDRTMTPRAICSRGALIERRSRRISRSRAMP